MFHLLECVGRINATDFPISQNLNDWKTSFELHDDFCLLTLHESHDICPQLLFKVPEKVSLHEVTHLILMFCLFRELWLFDSLIYFTYKNFRSNWSVGAFLNVQTVGSSSDEKNWIPVWNGYDDQQIPMATFIFDSMNTIRRRICRKSKKCLFSCGFFYINNLLQWQLSGKIMHVCREMHKVCDGGEEIIGQINAATIWSRLTNVSSQPT